MNLFTSFHCVIAIIMLFISSACGEDVKLSASANDFYHLKIDDAYLPVMVRGNTQSGVLLLFVQGGPGYPSIDFATIDYPKWKNTIEKDFAIAYYDQRGFGNKQGNTDLSTITLAQYQKDILQIARFLKVKYPRSKLVLFGHSWGGDLSYHYLINHASEPVVDAFISFCGPPTHDGENVAPLRWGFRRSYLINVADVFLNKGIDISYWQDAKTWALSTDLIDTKEERRQWNKYVAKGEKFTEGKIGISAYLKVGFASHYNLFPDLQYDLNDEVASALINDEIKTNITNDLHKIKLPTLLIGARFDDQAPLEELQFVFDHLGSPQKKFIKFAEAGHNVFLDEPDGFRTEVRDFCQQLLP